MFKKRISILVDFFIVFATRLLDVLLNALDKRAFDEHAFQWKLTEFICPSPSIVSLNSFDFGSLIKRNSKLTILKLPFSI